MEFMLTHKPRGIIPPEAMTHMVEQVKKVLAKPADFVPGGKLIASYGCRDRFFVFCIWDVPSIEALMPFVEQLNIAGMDNEIIPIDKGAVYAEKLEKALQAMKG